MKLIPYLNFDGRCREAFEFYEQLLDGKIEAMIPFEGTPAAEHVPAGARDSIMHARLVVGDDALMASDAPDRYQEPKGFHVSINVTDSAKARRVFDALAEKGTVEMPFEKTFWAAGGFGMVVDRFGTPWMINCE